ncbi:MAG: ATP synthase F0 subunit B [Candidatus Paceibacterota bacterium]|jgi:F-type H+-transporting ATPase subunit b
MEELVAAFAIDWHLLVAQMINFAIVFCVLYFFAIKPIIVVLDERQKVIKKGLDDAAMSGALLAKTEQESAAIIQSATKEAGSIVKKAQDEVSASRQAEISKTKAELEALTIKSKQDLEKEKEVVISQIKGEIGDLVAAALEKVVAGKSKEDIDK